MLAVAISSTAHADATYLRGTKPITDAQGRTQVIVDFKDDAHRGYPDPLPLLPAGGVSSAPPKTTLVVSANANPTEFFINPKVSALVRDVERQYTFTRIGMTSWVGNSVTALLTAKQIAALSHDFRVKQISDDESNTFSWTDSSSNGETVSWGHLAVRGKVRTASNARKVYVIDTGVAYHGDLGSVVQRVNVACGAYNCNASNPSVYPLVGCYPHSTHVAGVISATNGNGTGTRGIYAGARIVSLATGIRSGGDNCAPSSSATVLTSAVGYALDYVYWDALYNNTLQLVHIANISINPAGMAITSAGAQPNWSKARRVATPASVFVGCPVQCVDENDGYRQYPGVFIAQSAGNRSIDSTCNGNSNDHYTTAPGGAPDEYDGVMVVGALKADGTRPYSSNLAQPAFTASSPVNQASTEQGSNFGSCVEVWAPGDAIWSTWGEFQPNSTLVGVTYNNTARVSGTSFAAPHVAAAAAYYADLFNLLNPGAIEQKIRANFVVVNGLNMVQLN